jgi:hypothetical protein
MLFTEQHNQKIKEARLRFVKSKYKWDIVEPYLDIKINNGARNRKCKFITLREFKELKVDAGKTIKELVKEGYSAMLLRFYSKFCQGMIKLTKEELEEEYKINDLEYIAKKYKVDRGDIACLRQLYNIKSTSGMYFKRVREEKPLTSRQIEILYGTMLGDACGDSGRRISFKHGDCQKEYIFWKFDEFQEHCNPLALKVHRSSNKESYSYNMVSWMFRTKFHTEFEKCINYFYKDGKKEVCKEIVEHLTPLSVAVWYQDDGTTNFSHKRIEKTGHNITPVMSFCTDSFSEESCQILVNCLKNKFNIDSRLTKVKKLTDGTVPFNIYIKSTSAYDFLSLIRPHIIPSMLYKVDYEEYKKKV